MVIARWQVLDHLEPLLNVETVREGKRVRKALQQLAQRGLSQQLILVGVGDCAPVITANDRTS